MSRHIPPGKEDLYRRQENANAEVARLDREIDAATKRRNDLSEALGWDDPLVDEADEELGRKFDEHNRAVAVADRIYQERMAGLSSWIDHDPTAPVCTGCSGAGCKTCRGWGREARPPIPVWNERDQEWVDPTTGRTVDLLAEPAPPPTTSTGGSAMSKILDGQQLLLGAAQQLETLAPAVHQDGDPEEIGQILRAEQLEAESESKMAQAQGQNPEVMVTLALEAEELARQAVQLRQQAKEGLEARVANAKVNADTADQTRSMIREAVEGTRRGGEMITDAGGIHNAIEESGTALAGAASVATEREQTHECLGLIKQAQDHAAAAAGLCGKLSDDIQQYAGPL